MFCIHTHTYPHPHTHTQAPRKAGLIYFKCFAISVLPFDNIISLICILKSTCIAINKVQVSLYFLDISYHWHYNPILMLFSFLSLKRFNAIKIRNNE